MTEYTPSLIHVDELEKTGLVQAVFTTRKQGESDLVAGALNLGLHVGDHTDKVISNRQRVAQELGVSVDDWVAGEQIHSDRVAIITAAYKGSGAREYESSIPGSDAMITNEKGIVLSTYAADCVPMLFLDPMNKVIGVAHAGWKGTVAKIGVATIQAMAREYGTDSSTVKVVIGPSIHDCCYEVDAPVFTAIQKSYIETERFMTASSQGRWQLSLQRANASSLEEVGVPQEQIYVLNHCTRCENNLFFSHRAEQGLAGRHAGLIVLV